MSQQISHPRIENLDLIRAVAIGVVVIYHTVQMVGESKFGFIAKFTHLGQYGVDLFFVLSGFLIGRLYWEELIKTGTVDILRFISRRVLRTYSPYIVALFLSFIPAWIGRGQTFDFGYLLFLQNYYQRIPFFLVSWSLCIEEHFYVFLPLVLYFTNKLQPVKVLSILLISGLIPLILRLSLIKYQLNSDFGYYITATHFRCEGLILGVVASHIYTYFPLATHSIGNDFTCNIITLSAVVFASFLPFLSPGFIYYWGLTIVALLLFLLVLSYSSRSPISIAKNSIVKKIASSSYSVYLTHALTLHVVLLLANKANLHYFITWLLTLPAIFIVGNVFYNLVEKNSLVFREKIAPKKTSI